MNMIVCAWMEVIAGKYERLLMNMKGTGVCEWLWLVDGTGL